MISLAEEILLKFAKKEGYEDIQDWLVNASTYNQEEVIINAMLEYGKKLRTYKSN